MAIVDGQPVKASVPNSNFLDKTQDDETIGVVGLNNTATVESGNQIVNAQRLINELASVQGNTGEGDATAETYSSNNVVADDDDRKVAIGKLDGVFDSTTGHTHDGIDSAEIIDASPTQNGQVTTGAQSFAGLKDFEGGLESGSVEVLTLSDSQVITAKDIDGGTASNTNRITIPSDTKANLDSLTRKEGTILYATDDDLLYSDDGSTLNAAGGGGGITSKIAYVKEIQTSGTQGGTFMSGIATRVLNTVQGDNSFVSISSNQITLDPGTYAMDVNCPAYDVDGHKCNIYDITGAAVLEQGSTEFASSSNNQCTRSFAHAYFTIGSTNVYEIRHEGTTTSASTEGLGRAVFFGTSEIYTQVKITKIG